MPMSSAQLEEYRTRLYNEFLRRRVFLVLDDVWNKGVLEQLDLAKGRGSVTLVTTRNQPVLKKVGVIDEDEVQGVAELFAEERKGLPLALKVIGGSMVGKTTRQEWEFQLNCLRESRQLPEQQEEEALFGHLKLSYDNLDNDNPVSKECFLGFAAFPEDRMVKMKELIKLWKAEGLLDDPTKMFGDDPARAAYYLLGLLIGRSLIELAQNELDIYRCKDSYTCKVHDVMRDLALHIIEGQRPITCLYQPGKEVVEFPGDWIQKYERQPCEVRKLSLMENDLTTLNGVTFSAPKLDVLLLAQNEKLEAMPKQFLKGIENLKVLEPGTSQGKSRDNEIHQFSQHGEGLVTYLDQVGHFEITENGNFEEENLQKPLQHMLIGLQRHGEAAATNLHQFHAECMGDSIFVAAREVVQGVEFLFSDAQCMSRMVGVGLERAKVLVTSGYEVEVMQLSESNSKRSWEKVFSQVKDSESFELVAIKMPKLQGDHVKSTSLPAEDISRKFGVSLKDFPETHVITLNCKEEQSGHFFPVVWNVVDEYRNLKCGSTCATTKQTSGTGSTKSPNTSSSGSIQQSTSGGGPNFSQSPSLTRQEEKMDDDEDDDKSLPPEDPLPPDPSSAPSDMRNRRLKVSIFPGAGGAFHDPDTKQLVRQTPFQEKATIMPVIEIEFLQEGIDKKFITVTTKTHCNLGTDGGPEWRGVKLFSWCQDNINISFKGNDRQTQLLSSSASAQDDSLIEIWGIQQIQGCRENDLVFKFCLPGSSTQSGIDLQSLSLCDDTFEPKITGKWIVRSEEQHAYYVFKVKRYLYRLPSSGLHLDEIKCLMQDYKLLMSVNLAMTHLDRYDTNDHFILTEQNPELPYVIKVTPGG
ncbi:hypothetical protein BDL97_10G021400 [Sphagnum fallax]|nr:hypothetical protein BDL97_10G021400 [Sphagnum fallax]KAH8949238.1 hypothetical protein BDL97_10G021400 [Sphagnum fallax]KAH8949239.1 hypothetical protein BDL97_10G021400 [Sphagnum fallax]KAH8949240.1 hypothetical protein BDL97_10G021400 [Sphagnum fallax]